MSLNSRKLKKTRMFPFINKTINPIAGGPCTWNCTYCWAKKLISENDIKKYTGKWRLRESILNTTIKDGDIIFLQDMTDIGCNIDDLIICEILNWINNKNKNTFLLLTKNPAFYLKYINNLSNNIIIGVTLETDDDLIIKNYSDAPSPSLRIHSLLTLKNILSNNIFISIEPVMKYTDKFITYLKKIKPWAVAIGYDNYNHNLPEPSINELNELINELKTFTNVYEKTIEKPS